jgi:hypothetical protein
MARSRFSFIVAGVRGQYVLKWLVWLAWLGVWARGVAQGAPPIPLVNHGDVWHYRKGTNAPQADWQTAAEASLDATWASGKGGFGYADNTAETANCQTLLGDMEDHYTTLYLRKQFTITNVVEADLHLMLRMDWDDGYIAWLDGGYLTNAFAGGSAEPAYTAAANTSHESSRGNSSPQPAVTNDLGLASARLDVGTHTLAIIGLNQSSGSSDLILIADLYLDLPPVPPPPVTNVWPAANSPIVVTTNVIVAANETLVIEPGVTVALGAGLDITVGDGGRLLAEGTPEAPIRFTRSGASGYWGNLTINGSVGSPESRLAYAQFEFNANSTGTACIEVASGTAYLDHLTFGNPGAPYIHVDGASFVISHCYFPPATAQFELCHGTGGIKSGGHGVFFRNFFGKAIGYNDVVDFTGGNRPNQPIVHFIENVVTGSDDDAFDIDGTDAWVAGNIFLHLHKNRGTPDSSSAVSGGSNGGNTSEITVIGNLMYDCDQAATAKQGNFYTLVNNTIVHQTHEGGVDTDGAVVILADASTTQGAGIYLEGNIICDVEKLTRNVTDAVVTFRNNLLPFAWSGPGEGNSTSDPMLKHLPLMSETYFTNWAEAQIMRDWFSLLPGSPGIGAGPNGLDCGGVIPLGASISGEPSGTTTQTDATLTVGINRTGHGIPTAGWPAGAGYTHYKWRLDGRDWSAETPIATPISLTGLAPGPHYVEVSGRLDSGLYQDDPLFAEDATPTRSRTWTVAGPPPIEVISLTPTNSVQLQFTALANVGYRIEYRDSLTMGAWQTLIVLDPVPSSHAVTFADPMRPGNPTRFYRLAQY